MREQPLLPTQPGIVRMTLVGVPQSIAVPPGAWVPTRRGVRRAVTVWNGPIR